MKKITLFFLALTASFTINAQTTFSYNTDNVVTATNSVGCPGGDNDWARNFVFADFGFDTSADFNIESGEVGIQTNSAATITVSIYSSDTSFPGSFNPANLLGSQSVAVPVVDDLAGDLPTIVSFTFDTPITVPAGTTAIVYSVTVPLDNDFFIAGTADETADGYLRSANCGVADYTTPTTINFPNAHFYMTLTTETLSIDENVFANNISLFPNPTSGDLNIEFSRSYGDTDINITNINGQTVIRTTVDGFGNSTINTSDLATGVYFAKVTNESGSATIKFIKN